MVIINQKLSLIFMMKSYPGAVRGWNVTKYDLLRAPKQSLFVFCLISDYLYPVIAITQTFMLCLENVTCVMVVTNKQLWSCKLKPPAREFDGILPNISLPMPNDEY